MTSYFWGVTSRRLVIGSRRLEKTYCKTRMLAHCPNIVTVNFLSVDTLRLPRILHSYLIYLFIYLLVVYLTVLPFCIALIVPTCSE